MTSAGRASCHHSVKSLSRQAGSVVAHVPERRQDLERQSNLFPHGGSGKLLRGTTTLFSRSVETSPGGVYQLAFNFTNVTLAELSDLSDSDVSALEVTSSGKSRAHEGSRRPGASTQVTRLLGFAGLGLAGNRRRRKAQSQEPVGMTSARAFYFSSSAIIGVQASGSSLSARSAKRFS